MAISATNVQSHDWGDRRPDLFIDTMVKSAAVLNRFSLIDGVKNKVNVPIFDVTSSAFATGDDCEFLDNTTADIDEKEMTVETFNYGFKNCKHVLEKSYRGLALKKGQHNPETMDAEFRNWVFDYFAKLASQKALTYAASELVGEMQTDAGVIDYDTAAALSTSNILDKMQGAYEAMSDVMLSAIYGDADREFKPAFFLGTAAYQMYQIAIAELHTTTPAGIIAGELPTYYGMEVVHFPSLAADTFFISAPQNLVMLTDDYNDVKAIDAEYEAKENAEYLWGRFKLGFSFYKAEEIVLAEEA